LAIAFALIKPSIARKRPFVVRSRVGYFNSIQQPSRSEARIVVFNSNLLDIAWNSSTQHSRDKICDQHQEMRRATPFPR
jgi:hypothetical protein